MINLQIIIFMMSHVSITQRFTFKLEATNVWHICMKITERMDRLSELAGGISPVANDTFHAKPQMHKCYVMLEEKLGSQQSHQTESFIHWVPWMFGRKFVAIHQINVKYFSLDQSCELTDRPCLC